MNAETKLAEVAWVGDEHEAEMIRALLEAHGIPSLLQQVGPSGPRLGYGLLSPSGGSRRVMVHAHRVEEARALLDEARGENAGPAPEPAGAELANGTGRIPRDYGVSGAYARAFLWSFGAMALAFGAFMLLRAL